MKAHFWTLTAAMPLLVPLVACAGASGPSKPRPDTVVTLQGVGGADVSYLSLSLTDVSIEIDGKPASVHGISGVMDLAPAGEHAIARFGVPDGARSVTVSVAFDDYGAYEERSGRAGSVDARGKVLSLTVPASHLQSGKMAVSLDIGRSLSPKGSEWAFEPHLATTY